MQKTVGFRQHSDSNPNSDSSVADAGDDVFQGVNVGGFQSPAIVSCEVNTVDTKPGSPQVSILCSDSLHWMLTPSLTYLVCAALPSLQ